jgi:hypothetical protein
MRLDLKGFFHRMIRTFKNSQVSTGDIKVGASDSISKDPGS